MDRADIVVRKTLPGYRAEDCREFRYPYQEWVLQRYNLSSDHSEVCEHDEPNIGSGVELKRQMIQTGDPLGDGTGGESAWGGMFEDEFSPKVDFSQPYMLAMANAGPKTNGSQFFITTVPCDWLNNKHT
jgi:hypothetical protein